MTTTEKLTSKALDRIYGELKKSSTPTKACPECKRPVFTIGGDTVAGPCMDCQGLHYAEWVWEGVEFIGLVDKEGTPVFGGPKGQMDTMRTELNREDAKEAGKPIHLRNMKPGFVEIRDCDAPRFNWNPETQQFDRVVFPLPASDPNPEWTTPEKPD